MRKIISSLFVLVLLISCSSKANMKNVPNEFIPRTVVIDPGHSGKFSGINYSEKKITGKIFKEQDITLSISQELRKLFEKDPRFKAIMTRETDKELGGTLFKDLAARVKIAEDNNADLFVSIHVNASSGSGRDTCKQQGFEILYRSTGKDDNGKLDTPRGSTEEEKKHDAEKQENAKKEGIVLAAKVSEQLKNKGLEENREPYEDSAIGGHTIIVLRQSRWPAILVQAGYICNENDRKIMTDEPAKIAEGIYNGIVEYGKQSGWFE